MEQKIQSNLAVGQQNNLAFMLQGAGKKLNTEQRGLHYALQ